MFSLSTGLKVRPLLITVIFKLWCRGKLSAAMMY